MSEKNFTIYATGGTNVFIPVLSDDPKQVSRVLDSLKRCCGDDDSEVKGSKYRLSVTGDTGTSERKGCSLCRELDTYRRKTLEQRKRKDCSRKSRRGTVMISFLNKDSRIAVV